MIAPVRRAFIPVRPADLWDLHACVQSESSPLCVHVIAGGGPLWGLFAALIGAECQ